MRNPRHFSKVRLEQRLAAREEDRRDAQARRRLQAVDDPVTGQLLAPTRRVDPTALLVLKVVPSRQVQHQGR